MTSNPTMDADTALANGYRVYRTKTQSELIQGAALSLSIVDGSLVVVNNNEIVYIYGPDQWITVNVIPNP